ARRAPAEEAGTTPSWASPSAFPRGTAAARERPRSLADRSAFESEVDAGAAGTGAEDDVEAESAFVTPAKAKAAASRLASSSAAKAREAPVVHDASPAVGERGKLGAVDAIFAAAEVIARRPSDSRRHGSPSATTSMSPTNHFSASGPVSASGSFSGSSVGSGARPIKKRRVEEVRAMEAEITSPPSVRSRCQPYQPHFQASADDSTNASPSSSASRDSRRDDDLAERAVAVSRSVTSDPALYRALLLHMALEREVPRRPPGSTPQCRRRKTSHDDEADGIVRAGVSAGRRRGNQYVEGVGTPPGEGDGKVIAEGFFWKDVPELEAILRGRMVEYYEMSENRPQSKRQQEFNNRLVDMIRAEATRCGYVFDPRSFGKKPTTKKSKEREPLAEATAEVAKAPEASKVFEADAASQSAASRDVDAPGASEAATDDAVDPTDAASELDFDVKKLRDRIRCYYKTHIQNSKKRLITMLRDPTRPRNRDALLRLAEAVRGSAGEVEVGDGTREHGGIGAKGGVVGTRERQVGAGNAADRAVSPRNLPSFWPPSSSTDGDGRVNSWAGEGDRSA
ncbi:hypothetical protein ACHAWF_014276, partial [Thalassiosira exigua]